MIASLALAFSIWAIYGAGYEVIAKGFLLLMLGVPVYVYMKYRSNADMDAIKSFTTKWTTSIVAANQEP